MPARVATDAKVKVTVMNAVIWQICSGMGDLNDPAPVVMEMTHIGNTKNPIPRPVAARFSVNRLVTVLRVGVICTA